jgi:hypothetical protein
MANFLRLLSRNGWLVALDIIINAFRIELDRRRGIITRDESMTSAESFDRLTGV